MTLAKEIERLKAKRDETGILTIYLDTDISNQNGEEWKIELKNGMKELKKKAEQGGEKELKALENLLDEAETRIHDSQKEMQKSFLLIASADGELWEEKILQVPVETSFHWGEEAGTGQLDRLYRKYPEMGVIVIQQSDIRFLDTVLGEIREERYFSWDLSREDWVDFKEITPPSATDMGKDKFQSRFEENRHRWYKKLAPRLGKEVKDRNLKGAYLVGSQEYIDDLADNMDDAHVRGTVAKNLGTQHAHEILNVVYDEEIR